MKPSYRMPPLRVIGIIESDFREKFGAPRQPGLVPAARARLRLLKEFVPEQSLRGLNGFSHVWLLSYFHLATHKKLKPVVHPPRLEGGTVGVFASRSPHRPSPLGLSLARLEAVRGDALELSGIDLIDGTPVLDVKPFIPSYDAAPEASAGWTASAPERRLAVRFSRAALTELRRLERRMGPLEELVRQALSHDPRNPRDRSQHDTRRALEMRLRGALVRFAVRGGEASVRSVLPAPRRAPRAPAANKDVELA